MLNEDIGLSDETQRKFLMANSSSRAGLSLLDAARELGVSEKTLRRRIKAGEIEAEKVSLEGGGLEWRVFLDQAPTVPEVVPEATGARAGTQNDRAGIVPDTPADVPEVLLTVPESQRPSAPEVSETRAGTVPEVVPDTGQSTLVAHVLEENRFLRAQLEAAEQERRQRAEEHARQLAEVTAALREALKAQPRALLESTSSVPVQDDLSSQSTLMAQSSAAAANQPETGRNQEPQGIQSTLDRSKGLRGWLLRVLRG